MELQLSSGQGPAECELAVGKLLNVLQAEYADIEIIGHVKGRCAGGYRSLRIATEEDLSFLDGTVKWICQSPFRPNHKRKNWFIDISICGTNEEVEFDEGLVHFDTFRSGGKGGQHVNKVETGVRALHPPTGISVVCTETRSQHLNKKIALNRLCDIICRQGSNDKAALKALNRLEHTRLERGNPVRVYAGIDFRRKK